MLRRAADCFDTLTETGMFNQVIRATCLLRKRQQHEVRRQSASSDRDKEQLVEGQFEMLLSKDSVEFFLFSLEYVSEWVSECVLTELTEHRREEAEERHSERHLTGNFGVDYYVCNERIRVAGALTASIFVLHSE